MPDEILNDPDTDGVTHINIYSKAKTAVGMWMSNFTVEPIETEDGHFDSIEGYWYWLGTRDDRLRTLGGFAAKEWGRKLTKTVTLPTSEFMGKILKAINLKAAQRPDMVQRLAETGDLPLRHYYAYSGVVRDAGFLWLVRHWEHIRTEAQKGIKPEQEVIVKKTTVVNIYSLPGGKDPNAPWRSDPQYVYMGRPGPWGNPHPVGRECMTCEEREIHQQGEAVEFFKKEFDIAILFPEGQWGWKSVAQLEGKTLVCYCHPKPCHCDVPANYLNNPKGQKPQKETDKMEKFTGKRLAFTGHRPSKLGGYDQETFDKLTRFAEHVLDKLKPELVISGMALGWDQAVAQAALNLELRYTAACPGTWQPNAWKTQSDRDRWNHLIQQATELVNTDPDGIEGQYAGWKLNHRNKWMVDHAEIVVALWDGSNGGTGNCVTYAKSRKVPVINCWDKWTKGGW